MSEIEQESPEEGRNMSGDMQEVLDANIVILLEEPLTQTVNAVSLFEGRELASFMKKPLTVNQGLNLDLALGAAVGTYQVESMRSQKTISLSPVRIEVHDRSGETDVEKTKIPETMFALADALPIGLIKAIGANWEVTFKSLEGIPASTEIAKKLFREDTSFLPQKMNLIGGTARLLLSDDSGVVVYTLAIEPRGQNPTTEDLWMSCNATINNPEALSIEVLKAMFQQSYDLLFEVKKSLFPAPQQ